MKRITILHSVLVAALLGLVGCGHDGPEMGQVSGVVTYKGKPVPVGTITFIPEIESLPVAYAEIQPDGAYRAATKEYGAGVPIGKHRVMIMAVEHPGPEIPFIAHLPMKFSSDQTSGLSANVQAGENKIDFAIEK